MRLAFLLFLTLSVSAQPFAIGSGETMPAAGSVMSSASVTGGAVMVWRRSSDEVDFLVRVDHDGRPVGENLPLPAGERECRDGLVASDGRDALVVCRGVALPADSYYKDYTLMAARLTEEGLQELHELPVLGQPSALQWNGRHYVLAVRQRYEQTSLLLLLEQDGTPASGTVALPHQGPLSLACGAGRCLAASRSGGWYPSVGRGRIRGAVIGQASFPPAGQQAAPIRTLPLFAGQGVSVGFDALGFYSITSDIKGALALRRHGFLTGADPERGLFTNHIRHLQGIPQTCGNGGDLTVASHGKELYVAYQNCARMVLLHVWSDVVYEVRTSDPQLRQLGGQAGSIVVGASGAIAFWKETVDGPIYASAIDAHDAASSGQLVSAAPPAKMMPRLARGANTLLAAWLERTEEQDSLFVASLELDGRQRTAPVRLATAYVINDAAIAFDGTNFLIAWKEAAYSEFQPGASILGRLITMDGQPMFPTIDFKIRNYAVTLLWSGQEYLVTGWDDRRGGLWRISPSGVLLDGVPQYIVADVAFLVRTGEGALTGLGLWFEGTDYGAGPTLFANYYRISVGNAPHSSLSRLKAGFDNSATPAIALGEEHELFVVDCSWWERNLCRLGENGKTYLPYPPPAGDRRARLHAHWRGNEFLVGAGQTLARHAPDGTLLGTLSLGDDVRESAIVPDGPDAVIVLRQRGSRRLEALRVHLPPH